MIEEDTELKIRSVKTRAGDIQTPFFMPIATKGAIKHLLPREVAALGAQILLGNTYHLWLRPGDELIKEAGKEKNDGLHTFMNWQGPILTDSGGFQVFSLGARAQERFGKNGVTITEEGVEFSDPENGNRYFLSPEKSIDIQLNLGSDIIMVLDECPPYPCTHEYASASLERTTRWAKRAKDYFEEKMQGVPREKRPLLFGIVQGSTYQDLRIQSAKELIALSFDGYAIGGVAVGEPRELLKDILTWTLPCLPKNLPRYLMGMGRPEEIVAAVQMGVDMFDCVIPTREGRHGRLFVWRGDALDAEGSFYEPINIQNQKYAEDFSPLDASCDCTLCTDYTKSYLHHQFKVKEPLAGRLASVHNLRFYLRLMQKLQEKNGAHV